MIFDILANAACYYDVNPRFAAAFDFLHHTKLTELPVGRQSIDGENIYVIVDRSPGRGQAGARLEAHQRYIDIQLCISGQEEIGWRARQQCASVSAPYDAERDIMFFDDAPTLWLPVAAGEFALLMPEDAHAPLGGIEELHKVVVKVRLEA